MIATIVCGFFILLGIALIIISRNSKKDNDKDFLGTVLIATSTIVLTFSLIFGYANVRSRYDIIEKKEIEYELENTYPNFEALKNAETYNRLVRLGNNPWCRFSVEDRSEWLIDIDKYLRR